MKSKLLPAPIRRKINTVIAFPGENFFDSVPLDRIDNALEAHGFGMLDEDGEPWQGLLCGRDGRCIFDIGASNAVLVLHWHKFDTTGRYEIVAYVS